MLDYCVNAPDSLLWEVLPSLAFYRYDMKTAQDTLMNLHCHHLRALLVLI